MKIYQRKKYINVYVDVTFVLHIENILKSFSNYTLKQ